MPEQIFEEHRILNCSFTALDLGSAAKLICEPATESRVVVTPNLDFLRRMDSDANFERSVNSAWMRLADGVPIVWLSKMKGIPGIVRVAGADLVPAVLNEAVSSRVRVAVVGSDLNTLLTAASTIHSNFGAVEICGVYSPPVFDGENWEVINSIQDFLNSVMPSIVFVCLGSPKQEITAFRLGESCVATYVCCGAAFDFIGGKVSRAPNFIQVAGLEWLWRLLSDPGRLAKRYFLILASLPRLILKYWNA